MKNILLFIVTLGLVLALAYGLWQLTRTINYKFGYQSLVQKQIAPLDVRIKQLEKEVEILKNK